MRESDPQRPISDKEAHELLTAAREALGLAAGATVHGDAALTAARKALMLLTLGLVMASDRAAGDLP